ncbi:hypothetical protein [Mucilaginibacter flavidus]|uniref:hypothetical protein n=1 Tax=Mucilaginibacter flavidus TaxID=2949309 RepID=UPI002092F13E|nr:hypothetical protein [Mucilaginibacter flavidus]MCO5946064.1 hypothetical protein [Mucilaginibacter flavidus]
MLHQGPVSQPARNVGLKQKNEIMRGYILLFALIICAAYSFAQSADDAEFKRIMMQYEQKLKHVTNPADGVKLLNEMRAKQQEYLAKKMDTVAKIKNKYGVDQAEAAAAKMRANPGSGAQFEGNPLYTKCKVEMTYSYNQDDYSGGETGHASFKGTGNCSLKMTTYLFRYLGKIVLTTPKEAIIEQTVNGTLSATGIDVSTGGTFTYNDRASAISPPLPGLSLNYESPTHWNAGARVVLKGTHTPSVGEAVVDTPDMHADATNDNGTLVIAGNTITITRNYNDNTTTGSGNHIQKHSFTGALKMVISPAADQKYLAFFDFDGGQEAYAHWMPEGYRAHSLVHGNYIDVKIKVESPAQPGKDFTSQIKYIKWELPSDEVSRVPGYANNAPDESVNSHKYGIPKSIISKLADLQLHLTTDLADTTVENLKLTSTATNNYTARVYSFDYGAWGKLIAHITLTDGTEIIAKARDTQSEFLLLPKRDPESKIATYFKQMNRVLDKKDDADDEKILSDDKYPGDGFTLYEEYRGFMENGKHFRGDPNAKDVMIYNGVNTNRSRDGIATYEMILNNYTSHVVKTHHRFTLEEFGLQQSSPSSTEIKASLDNSVELPYRDKWLNFNNFADLHKTDQHGICILGTEATLGYAFASANVGGHCGPPKDFDFLVISADFSPDTGGYARIKVDLDSLGNITVNPNGHSLVTTDEYAITVAHEMLHNSGVNHHGDHKDFNDGDKSTFVYADNGTWKVNGIPGVTLYWEANPGVAITDIDPKFGRMMRERKNKLVVRSWHGTCSGNEDCVMRYDDADAYSQSPSSNVIYIVPQSRGRYGELTGTHLCTSGAGTGVNAPGHFPISRYSDANTGMGDCIHQFCINDKFAH